MCKYGIIAVLAILCVNHSNIGWAAPITMKIVTECGPKGHHKPVGTPCSCDDPKKPETCVGSCDAAGNCVGKK